MIEIMIEVTEDGVMTIDVAMCGSTMPTVVVVMMTGGLDVAMEANIATIVALEGAMIEMTDMISRDRIDVVTTYEQQAED